MSYQYVSSGSFMPGVAIMSTVIFLVALVPAIAVYVLRALSISTIARRRGLDRPWLAWVPVGQEWLLGSLSDQFQYLTAGKAQSRRKILLGLGIAGWVLGLIVGITMIANVVMDMFLGGESSLALFGIYTVGGLACAVVAVVSMVFRYIALYDVYKSCDPKNATAYLVVGILFQITEVIFLMFCRNKEDGMPPRRPEPQPEPWQAPVEE